MLYLVATPIGNLNDLSLRQAKTLAESDIILAEDTRSAAVLIQKIKVLFGFQKKPSLRIISYYKEKEFEKLAEIIDLLQEGKKVSLISESGMPLLSDPGYLLLKTAIKEKIPFEVIPGPSAITTAAVYSGFSTDKFMYLGFLPKKESKLFQLFNQLKQIKKDFSGLSIIFFESPKRLSQTLKIISEILPEAEICICREMTKMFEEAIRGKAKDLINRSYRGEITVVLN